MLGLVFATWEKYLSEKFGNAVLQAYRGSVAGMIDGSPLANRVYDDEALAHGLAVVSRLTNTSSDLLLRQFGRHFINHSLTRHLCVYLLSQTHCARDLVLLMRKAHMQMAVGPDGLTSPVFTYEFLTRLSNRPVGKHNSSLPHWCYQHLVIPIKMR